MLSGSTGARLNKITFSTHTGTHVDTPSHVFEDGAKLESIELERFIGSYRVVGVTLPEISVTLNDVKQLNPQKGERILRNTSNSACGPNTFNEEFVFVSREAAQFPAEQEIALTGIDYFSIKQKGSPDNRPHTEFLSKGIPVLEGIDLSDVAPGDYFLSCAPLRFEGLDGSPCRALLFR